MEETLGASIVHGMNELLDGSITYKPALDLISQYKSALFNVPTSSRTPTPEAEVQLEDVMERLEEVEKRLTTDRPLKRRKINATWTFDVPVPLPDRKAIDLAGMDRDAKRKIPGYFGLDELSDDEPEEESAYASVGASVAPLAGQNTETSTAAPKQPFSFAAKPANQTSGFSFGSLGGQPKEGEELKLKPQESKQESEPEPKAQEATPLPQSLFSFKEPATTPGKPAGEAPKFTFGDTKASDQKGDPKGGDDEDQEPKGEEMPKFSFNTAPQKTSEPAKTSDQKDEKPFSFSTAPEPSEPAKTSDQKDEKPFGFSTVPEPSEPAKTSDQKDEKPFSFSTAPEPSEPAKTSDQKDEKPFGFSTVPEPSEPAKTSDQKDEKPFSFSTVPEPAKSLFNFKPSEPASTPASDILSNAKPVGTQSRSKAQFKLDGETPKFSFGAAQEAEAAGPDGATVGATQSAESDAKPASFGGGLSSKSLELGAKRGPEEQSEAKPFTFGDKPKSGSTFTFGQSKPQEAKKTTEPDSKLFSFDEAPKEAAKPFTFGGSVSGAGGSVSGTATSSLESKPASSTNAQDKPSVFGAPTSGSAPAVAPAVAPAFGSSAPSTAFGPAASNSTPSATEPKPFASSGSAASNNQGFSFGKPAELNKFSFGNTPAGGFSGFSNAGSLGGAPVGAPSANPMGGANNPGAPNSNPFGATTGAPFGAASGNAPAAPFGANSFNSKPSFNFAAQQPANGGFNFGAAGNGASGFNFGGASNGGATNAFGANSQANPNIGTSNTGTPTGSAPSTPNMLATGVSGNANGRRIAPLRRRLPPKN